ncbi:MAG: glycosyltransferase [Lachnospiraceae bacterium]|nr:glycosyltransferase [Lachnospiraceae bacterium]MCM1237851.1 glycosyltransferase [Lachnospiraceae bacterium]
MKVIFGSVVYPTALKYLDDFLKSLNEQTDQQFELLLVNDGIEKETLNAYIQKYKNLSEKTIVLKADAGQAYYLLRILLLKEAKRREGTILILGDCDDFFSRDRVTSVVSEYKPEMWFFYNEILDFAYKPVMPILPKETKSIYNIAEYNYLGLSNTAINLDKLSIDFLNSLQEGNTSIFDWYLFSRIVLAGGGGMYLCHGKSYYRIHEMNLAGIMQNTEDAINKEIRIKLEHYRLLKNYSQYIEGLLADYSAGNIEKRISEKCPQKFFWWGLTERRK